MRFPTAATTVFFALRIVETPPSRGSRGLGGRKRPSPWRDGLAAFALLAALLASAPALATTIGPDSFGYRATDEVGMDFIDISGTGTRVLAGSDDVTTAASIGFSFPFYGAAYTQAHFTANGMITFNAGQYQWTNQAITGALGFNQPAIMALWDDWQYFQTGADASYYQTIGDPGERVFVVQWNTAFTFSYSPGSVTFQILLYESSGAILFQYQDTNSGDSHADGASSTVGIRDIDGNTNGRHLQWSFNSPTILSGQALLFTPECGNGVVNSGEDCDDGDLIDGDGCSNYCERETGFACSGAPSSCSTTCGDGVAGGPETCDDGDLDANDGCSDSCTTETGYHCSGAPSACATVCGDGVAGGSESCDDGDVDAGDGCSAGCISEAGFDCTGTPSTCAAICSDGLVVGEEPCDDGDLDGGDGCSVVCALEAGFTCTGAPSVCVSTCGDGLPVGVEDCDDGDIDDGDGCTANCVIEQTFFCSGTPSVCMTNCGNGAADAGEDCDDSDRVGGDGCSAVCLDEDGWACAGAPSACTPVTGDGVIIGSEQCDDGNADDGDCCSSTGQFQPDEPACFIAAEVATTNWFSGPFQHLTAGVEFTVRSDLSVTSIGVPDCGDDGLADAHTVGIWDENQVLLATAVVPSGVVAELVGHSRQVPIPALALEAGRNYVMAALYPQSGTDCVVTAGVITFDPRVEYVNGREIFTAAGFSYPTDPNTHRFGPSILFASRRGDAVVDVDEDCDDGNVEDGDGCTANGVVEYGHSCTGEPSACGTTCGDGVIAGDEACDDDNDVSDDGCSSACAIEDGYTCTSMPSSCSNACGDGVVDSGEKCDDGDVAEDDGCNSDCAVEPSYLCSGEPSVCTTNCGNGALDYDEECDDGNLLGGDCCSAHCRAEMTSAACHMALSNPGGGGGSGGVNVVEGWEFTVSEAVTIASVGVYDEPSATGLAEPHEVAIWDGSQQLLATATVPAGTGGALLGNFRFVSIPALVLQPGENYTIGAFFPVPRFDTVSNGSIHVLDPRITIVTGRRLPFVASMVYPSSTDPFPRVGPTFLLSLDGCGDGVSDPDEGCDDGNLGDGDCCTSGCAVHAGVCSDGDACTQVDSCVSGACVGSDPVVCSASDQCHNAGTCNSATGSCTDPAAANGTPCADADLCIVGDTCVGGSCVAGSSPLDCDDENPCTEDSCMTVTGCVHDGVPVDPGFCLAAGKAKLQLDDEAGTDGDSLKWQWGKGDAFDQASLGSPDVDTIYALCVYDTSAMVPSLSASILVQPSADFWDSRAPKGWGYKDSDASSSGMEKMQLKPGLLGKTKIKLAAGGFELPLPGPVGGGAYFDQDPSVLVQLLNSEGACWSSEFAVDGTSTNSTTSFKASAP